MKKASYSSEDILMTSNDLLRSKEGGKGEGSVTKIFWSIESNYPLIYIDDPFIWVRF